LLPIDALAPDVSALNNLNFNVSDPVGQALKMTLPPMLAQLESGAMIVCCVVLPGADTPVQPEIVKSVPVIALSALVAPSIVYDPRNIFEISAFELDDPT
jgi:hypothetical protein